MYSCSESYAELISMWCVQFDNYKQTEETNKRKRIVVCIKIVLANLEYMFMVWWVIRSLVCWFRYIYVIINNIFGLQRETDSISLTAAHQTHLVILFQFSIFDSSSLCAVNYLLFFVHTDSLLCGILVHLDNSSECVVCKSKCLCASCKCDKDREKKKISSFLQMKIENKKR